LKQRNQALEINMQRRPLLRAGAFVAAALWAGLAAGQGAYPNKPVALVVPNPPGGLVDTSARILGDSLGKALGQPVVIDNRPGGSGNVAYGFVARAPADGYTLLTSYSAYHVGNPSLTPKLPWAQKDFAPIALITVATNVIAAHPSVPANTLQEFIAYLKKNPGKLSYASQGNGSVSHIGTEMFKGRTGTSMVHIPYRGSGAAIQDVLSGQVQVFMTTPPSVMQHVVNGKLKAFAVTGKTRHPGLPNVPTTAEAGLKGFELESWVAIFAPANTPADVVQKLTTGIRQALETPEAKSRADAAGIEIRYQSPAQLEAMVKSETDFWARTIKAQGITAD
jgi:tripartite-type tricarboxylate transporter receptor subunit TctC